MTSTAQPDYAARKLPPLTPREATICERLRLGESDKLIAEYLGISSHTVAWHMRAIFEKFGAHTRTRCVALYVEASVTDLHERAGYVPSSNVKKSSSAKRNRKT
jgi:DNA-binding CsgD family transcriptional regulator